MQYRTLGRTGLMTSALSFGVMRLSEPAVVLKALELGINYFDTAHSYQNGNNEKMLGEVLKQYGRKKVFIATKVKPFSRIMKKILDVNLLVNTTFLESKVEKSLRRLQTDYVDVLFLHAIDEPSWPANEDLLRFCEKMKKDGKARFVGITFHASGKTYVDIVDQALKTNLYDVFLSKLNFKSPLEHIEALKRAREKNVGIIAMKTQAGGYKLAADQSLNPHQAALKWALDCKFVDCAIPGMVNHAQLLENTAVIGKKVGWNDRKTLAAYYDAVKDRFCLSCGTCISSCEKSVDIPSINRSLMYWEGYQDFDLGRTAYRELMPTESALVCLDCFEPGCKCINGIKISERMRHAHRAFS